MQIAVNFEVVKATAWLSNLQKKQVPFATATALNETAKDFSMAIIDKMKDVFSNPTPYTLRGVKVLKFAKKDRLQAHVGLRNDSPGKGGAWDRVLGHQFNGGQRAWKRSEGAFMHAGILPSGMAMVPPDDSSWAVKLDAYGNVPPSLIVVLLSYFQAFPEQGYRANSTKKTRDKRAKFGTTAEGYKTINGVVYFVSLRGRGNHLADGIWAKRGTHGSDVAPVLMFVRRPTYRKRIYLKQLGEQIIAKVFSKHFKDSLSKAIQTSK